MPKDSISAYFIPCPSKKYLGLDCPGCGMQRAYLSAAKGNIKESFQFNPGAIPFLFLIIYTALHLKFKYKYGPKIIIGGFILTAAAMWIAYLVKLFQHL